MQNPDNQPDEEIVLCEEIVARRCAIMLELAREALEEEEACRPSAPRPTC